MHATDAVARGRPHTRLGVTCVGFGLSTLCRKWVSCNEVFPYFALGDFLMTNYGKNRNQGSIGKNRLLKENAGLLIKR